MNKKQFRRIVGFILTALLIIATLMIAASTAAAVLGMRGLSSLNQFQ